jgi:hypothetical protein
MVTGFFSGKVTTDKETRLLDDGQHQKKSKTI